MKKLSLWEIIDEIDELDGDLNVFYVKALPLSLHTMCMLLDETESMNDPYTEILEYFMSVHEISEVIENLEGQIKNPDDEVILDALEIYKTNGSLLKVC